MAFTRPVVGADISAADFGQPVYDWITQSGTPSAWTNFASYQNGWALMPGQQPGQYRKVGDIVQVRGVVYNGTKASAITTLPAGFRPPYTMYFPATCWSGDHFLVRIEIQTGGNILLDWAAGGVNQWISINSSFSTI